MRRPYYYILLSLTVTSLLLSGCKPKTVTRIGVSQCSNDIWREKQNEELRTSAYLYDNVEMHFATAHDDDQVQIAQIDSFIEEGVDLLIVAPNQMHTISPAIDRAYRKGIPVILFDRKTDSPHYTAFMGADNYIIGKTMGEYIAGMLHGHGSVVEIKGLAGSSPALDRHRGLTDALSKYPGIRLTASESGDWTEQSGQRAMESILRKNPGPIDCVFGQNDRMAIGARKVMEKQASNTHTRYVGIDALPTKDGGIQMVRDGILTASYIYPTRGDKLMQLAMNILQGKPYQRENRLQSAIVTKDNAEVMLVQADELNKQNDQLETLHSHVDHFLAAYNSQKIYLALLAVILVLMLVVFVVIFRSIVARRRMEEKAAESKLAFFTNVSHELRTPLTLVSAPIEQLYDDKSLSAQQHRLLGIALRNANILLQLINEILDLRKLQNGKMQVQWRSVDVVPLMREWTEVFRPAAEHKQLALSANLPEELPAVTDVDKLQRICYNLLSNAIKYTPAGGEVILTAKERQQQLIIMVEDNGIGIAKDKLNTIFERFYQVDPQASNSTGVGLALVKSFTELLGGTVKAERREPKGTRFVVTLPVGEVDRKQVQEQDTFKESQLQVAPPSDSDDIRYDLAANDITDTETSAKHRVLVVDDNEDIRQYLLQLLSPTYDVTTATDGKDALDKARREVPDVVVSDVMMPVMDGLQLCRALKEDMATSHIPVLLLTARVMDQQRAEGYYSGADAYITKPFDGKVLLARIDNLISNRQQLKSLFSNADVEKDEGMTTDKRFAEKFREAIQQNLSNSELSIEDISTELGLSRVQLYRKVKAMTGRSPVEILREARLKRAERLLATTDKTVAEIAYEVGFSTPSYFNRCYKDYFGHTPKEK